LNLKLIFHIRSATVVKKVSSDLIINSGDNKVFNQTV